MIYVDDIVAMTFDMSDVVDTEQEIFIVDIIMTDDTFEIN